MSEEKNDYKIYYESTFPVEDLYSIFLKNPNREFSFTCKNVKYIRYLYFNDFIAFKKAIATKSPIKIDVGPIFLRKISQGEESRVLKRELIFDLDLTDYKRTCCEGKTMCNVCFIIIKCSYRLMEFILKKKLGFKHVLFVLSGGRGMHVWVFDKSIMKLDNNDRNNILKFLNLPLLTRKDRTQNEMKFVQEVLEILRKYDYYLDIVDPDLEKTDSNLIEYLYLKLDKQVTAEMKHLLKTPFSVHQTTGVIATPIFADEIDDFSVEKTIKLSDFIADSNIIEKHLNYFKSFTQLVLKQYEN